MDFPLPEERPPATLGERRDAVAEDESPCDRLYDSTAVLYASMSASSFHASTSSSAAAAGDDDAKSASVVDDHDIARGGSCARGVTRVPKNAALRSLLKKKL